MIEIDQYGLPEQAVRRALAPNADVIFRDGKHSLKSIDNQCDPSNEYYITGCSRRRIEALASFYNLLINKDHFDALSFEQQDFTLRAVETQANMLENLLNKAWNEGMDMSETVELRIFVAYRMARRALKRMGR
ncbi:MAG: hypothetical protein AAFZ15_33295 [Bacteroidota bacterium]